MLESDNFLGWNDVITDVEALNLTLFEGIGKLLDVIHYNQVVAYVQVLQSAISLSDNFTELAGWFARNLGVRDVADSNTARVQQALRDQKTSFVANLLIVIQPDLTKALTHSQKGLNRLCRLFTDQVMVEEEAFYAGKRV